MGNYSAQFGGGRMEKSPKGYLASRLPYGDIVNLFVEMQCIAEKKYGKQ